VQKSRGPSRDLGDSSGSRGAHAAESYGETAATAERLGNLSESVLVLFYRQNLGRRGGSLSQELRCICYVVPLLLSLALLRLSYSSVAATLLVCCMIVRGACSLVQIFSPGEVRGFHFIIPGGGLLYAYGRAGRAALFSHSGAGLASWLVHGAPNI